MQDSQNNSASNQNILANSIKIARERITSKLDKSIDNNHDHEYPTFLSSHSKSKKDTTSIAQAIKVLQNRISELQAFNASLTRQNSQAKKQINFKEIQMKSVKQQLQIYELRMEQANKKTKLLLDKISSLEQSLTLSQQHLKQKQHQLTNLTSIHNEHLLEAQKNKESLNVEIEELKQKINTNHKIIVMQIKELEEMKEKNEENQHIKKFILNSPEEEVGIEGRIQKNSKSKSRENITFPVIVDSPEVDNSMLMSNIQNQKIKKSVEFNHFITYSGNYSKQKDKKYRKKSKVRNQDISIKILQEKNQQLYQLLKIAQNKHKQQQKLKKQFINKFYGLKAVCDGIIDQINKLPFSYQHKFKCLIVKMNKIDGDHLKCLRSHSRHTRISSKGSSNASKSKQKPYLKMQDLNASSNYSKYSHSHSKEKLRISRKKQREYSGKKLRQEEIMERQEKQLKKKINQKQKLIIQMHRLFANQNDQDRKNQIHQKLAFQMQEKTALMEELTKLKKIQKYK